MADLDRTRLLRVGVVKLASCDGCQLALLGLGGTLLELATRFQLVEFGEASSSRAPDGPFDVLLVEGSVSTPEQLEQIHHLRARSTLLVTIGACATSGGIQALRNWAATGGGLDGVMGTVYPRPGEIEALPTSTPVAQHVTVDAELRGCPIDPGQLVELLTAVSMGRRPQLPDEAVCVACKRAGRVCVLVATGEPCLGPVTRTGCGSLCPGFARGCYGCFGPRESANVESLATWFEAHNGLTAPEIARRFSLFTGWAPEFRSVVAARGGPPGFPSAPAPSGPAPQEARHEADA